MTTDTVNKIGVAATVIGLWFSIYSNQKANHKEIMAANTEIIKQLTAITYDLKYHKIEDSADYVHLDREINETKVNITKIRSIIADFDNKIYLPKGYKHEITFD